MVYKSRKWILSVLVFFLVQSSWAQNEGNLSGTINLDSTWSDRLFLSYIKTFEDLYAMSNDMIIAETRLSKEGTFSFDLSFLPPENNLFRLHIVKKKDAPTSLTIGGRDENHLFFIGNRNSDIRMYANQMNPPFWGTAFGPSDVNQSFQALTDLIKSRRVMADESSAAKRQFIQDQLNTELLQIADTSVYPLVSLYALYQSDLDNNMLEYPSFFQDYKKRWKGESNAYFSAFRQKLPRRTNWVLYGVYLLVGTSLLGIGYFMGQFQKTKAPTLNQLTVQERKVYELLKKGASNQEISDTHHIGVSTVKSHVSSIYRKLNVKSRKEIMNL